MQGLRVVAMMTSKEMGKKKGRCPWMMAFEARPAASIFNALAGINKRAMFNSSLKSLSLSTPALLAKSRFHAMLFAWMQGESARNLKRDNTKWPLLALSSPWLEPGLNFPMFISTYSTALHLNKVGPYVDMELKSPFLVIFGKTYLVALFEPCIYLKTLSL